MTIAIGDIHGCLHPLKLLIPKLPPAEPLVFLGDYIDRGPHSFGVIEFLQQLSQQRTCHFLTGNHEDLMLKVSGASTATNWLMNGGDSTLRSYKTDPLKWFRSPDKLAFLKQHRHFFENLVLSYEDEHAIYVHAGIDPSVPSLQQQKRDVLLWIREDFFQHLDLWSGKPIIFGHTPTTNLGSKLGSLWRHPRAIGIDTGCVYGGVLTALQVPSYKSWRQGDSSMLDRHRLKQKNG